MGFDFEIRPDPRTLGPGGTFLTNKTTFEFRVTNIVNGSYVYNGVTYPAAFDRWYIQISDGSSTITVRDFGNSGSQGQVTNSDGQQIAIGGSSGSGNITVRSGYWIPIVTSNIVSGSFQPYFFTNANTYTVSMLAIYTSSSSTGSQTVQAAAAAPAIPLQEYSPPRIAESFAIRCDQNLSESNLGRYIATLCAWEYSSLGGANTATGSFVWGEQGGAVSAPIALSNGVWSAPLGGDLDPTVTYVVVITVSDALGADTTLPIPINRMLFTVDLLAGGNGAAFGMPQGATKDGALEVGWKLDLGLGLTVSTAYYRPPNANQSTPSAPCFLFANASGRIVMVLSEAGTLITLGTVYTGGQDLGYLSQ